MESNPNLDTAIQSNNFVVQNTIISQEKQEAQLPNLQPSNLFDVPMNDPLHGVIQAHIANSVPTGPRLQMEDVEQLSASWEERIGAYGRRGLWRGLASYTKKQIAGSEPGDVIGLMKLWCYRLIALIQLNLCQLANAELEKLPDLFSSEFRFELHPHRFPEKQGSMVPFILKIIWARLPAYLGDTLLSIDRLYFLIASCRKEIEQDNSLAKLWQSRIIQITLLIVNYLLELEEHVAATHLLVNLAEHEGNDPNLWDHLIKLHLQGGNLQGAEQAYQRFEEHAGPEHATEITMNAALILMARGRWSEAAERLESELANSPLDYKISNNLAICNLYLCNLPQTLQILQTIVKRFAVEGQARLPSTLLSNLTNMYELATSRHLDKKAELLDLLHPFVGDGFDVAAFRLT